MVALPAICQVTQLAEVQIIREWSAKKDINVVPGQSVEWMLEDDTARYFHPPAGKRIRARMTFLDTSDTTIVPIGDSTKIDAKEAAKFPDTWNNSVIQDTLKTPGWYKNTISYSKTVGSEVSYEFIGTKISLYGERLPTHGTGIVTIDNGPEHVVSFAGGQLLPHRFFTSGNLTPQKHTVRLKVVSGWCLLDFFIVHNYQDLPVIVNPPTENILELKPGDNIKEIIETASDKTIKLTPGSYTTDAIHVPLTVSILCDDAILFSNQQGSEGGGTKAGVLNFNSGSRIDGNQYVEGCVIDGRNVGYSGIMVSNRNNITIKNVTVMDTNFNAVWLSSSSGSIIQGCKFKNAAWSDARYLSGAVNIADVQNLIIKGNEFYSDKNAKGTGIEALWKNTTLTNVKILSNTFNLSHHNPWNNGTSKNFSIELHDTYYRGLEIANNEFQNEVSLASHRPGNGTKTLIHHNIGNLEGDTYFLETVADDFEIYENVVSNCQMFAANFQANSKWKNWVIRDNQLLNSAGVPPWGAAVLIGPLGVDNVVMERNSFPSPLIKYMGTTGGVVIR